MEMGSIGWLGFYITDESGLMAAFCIQVFHGVGSDIIKLKPTATEFINNFFQFRWLLNSTIHSYKSYDVFRRRHPIFSTEKSLIFYIVY